MSKRLKYEVQGEYVFGVFDDGGAISLDDLCDSFKKLQSENAELKAAILSHINDGTDEEIGLRSENAELKAKYKRLVNAHQKRKRQNADLKSRRLTMSRYRELDKQRFMGQITLSRMIELINEEFTKTKEDDRTT